MEFLGYRSATHHFPALQDKWMQPGSPQVKRSDERVVAGADDYDVVSVRHRVERSWKSDEKSGVSHNKNVSRQVRRLVLTTATPATCEARSRARSSNCLILAPD